MNLFKLNTRDYIGIVGWLIVSIVIGLIAEVIMIAREYYQWKHYRLSKFEIEDVEDAYTYYVQILGISENLFWHADYSFVLSVVDNKTAYDGWLNYVLSR